MLGYRPLFLVFFVLGLCSAASAQIYPTPTPTPRPGTRQANVPPTIADNEFYDRLRAVEILAKDKSQRDHPLLDPKKGIYRRPSNDETKILAVSEPLLTKHAAFLRESNTGIVKLNAESSCISETDVIVATEKCLDYKMPGAGTAYSFRTLSYRIPRLADVILVDGTFMTGGVFQQVIMTEIGDIPLESVTLGMNAMKYLAELKPVSDNTEFMRFNDELIKGFEANGFQYGKRRAVKKDAVYILRSIAYRGQFLRSIEGVKYNELDFDKRRDIIVALRVADIDDTGNVTITWKRLKDSEAPKLKMLQ